MAGEVERLEPWQLPGYLAQLRERGVAEVGWNKERLVLDEALKRAEGLTETATVVADGEQVYVAEPDHSADDPPRIRPVPLQIWPRKP
ncbi:MAG TPA: hypothetical protein VFX49_16035 [Chloroflexota bacterium]|nr:hypothetical protein [Chloroflexota bacterium]